MMMLGWTCIDWSGEPKYYNIRRERQHPTTMSSILTQCGDGVLTVTLNRPEKLNALTGEMLAQLYEALAAAENDDSVRALLLTGAGRGFCAGQDLQAQNLATAGQEPNLGEVLDSHYNPVLRKMTGMRKPLVCAVNGVAAGAGANLPLACDIVFAAKSAKFIQAFAKIGLIPDAGGTWHLPHTLGLPRAKALTLLNEPLSAHKAAEWGLIWKAVDDDELMAEAGAAARELARGPTFGLGLSKHAMHRAMSASLDEQLDTERDLQQRAGRTPDHAESVRAFIEKRTPRFSGKPS